MTVPLAEAKRWVMSNRLRRGVGLSQPLTRHGQAPTGRRVFRQRSKNSRLFNGLGFSHS